MSLGGTHRRSGDDAGLREVVERVANLEADLRKAQASLGGLQGLIDTQTAQSAQVAFLSGQTAYAANSGGSTYSQADCTATVSGVPGYLPWDPDFGVSLTITTSSTGELFVQTGWNGNVYSTRTTVGDVSVFQDIEYGGMLQTDITWGMKLPAQGSAGIPAASASLITGLDPNTEYTFRLRQGATTSSQVFVNPGSSWITVTKLGMRGCHGC